MTKKKISGWGQYPIIEAQVLSSTNPDEIYPLIRNRTIIARGSGRSYGDAALAKTIFETLPLSKILSIDTRQGFITTEVGILLKDLLNAIIPLGYSLPVLPGTKYITLGGAIAADIHGKNHLHAGSFSNHLISFDLLTVDGQVKTCSRNENAALFWNTCGGMGLTGIIVRATIQLLKIETAYLSVNKSPVSSLEDLLLRFQVTSEEQHSVAWINFPLVRGRKIASIFTTARHLSTRSLPSKFAHAPLPILGEPRFNLPCNFPSLCLNATTLKIFNQIYSSIHSRSVSEMIVPFDSFFFTLDQLKNWNRLYGKNGLIQYQFVLPSETSLPGLTKIFDEIQTTRPPVFLAVLKILGTTQNRGSTSFAMPGFTLALDFKATPATMRLLEKLDEILLSFGGRIYLAKDSRMNHLTFKRMYPQSQTPTDQFNSLQSDRLYKQK